MLISTTLVLVFFTTIGFGAMMPSVVKYLKKLENMRHPPEVNHSINDLSDEESNLERYSIQRYDSTSNSEK